MTPKTCETCANAIFSPVWGEYKCKIDKLIVYAPNAKNNCKDYKNGKVSETKGGSEDA